jgi:predicted RNA-binding protein associated with RNAse of E/G family
MSRTVEIHYRRPPDRLTIFRQQLVLDRQDVKVTFSSGLEFDPPLTIDGAVALETGSEIVWFTFPGRWHDIGRFHTADGGFRGCYANILTPPVFEPGDVWTTTDLFLDVWLRPGHEPAVLDRDEFEDARERGWLDVETARMASREVDDVLAGFAQGSWPPPVVDEWPLERARAAAHPPRS